MLALYDPQRTHYQAKERIFCEVAQKMITSSAAREAHHPTKGVGPPGYSLPVIRPENIPTCMACENCHP